MTDVESPFINVAREIGPQLRQAGADAERQRRLPKSAFELLAGAGLQRMLLPKSLGGL